MIIETNDNIKLFLDIKGKGPPCIFIHGGPGSWSKEFEVICGKYLEVNMKMIYLDQRGCGRSSGDKNTNYDIDILVEDLELIRKSLHIEKWIIIAHSFGGIIATEYAKRYEDYLESMILLNCTLNMNDSLLSQIEYGCRLLKLDINDYISDDIINSWKRVAYELIKNDLYYKLQFKEYENYQLICNIDKNMENTNMSQQALVNKSYFENYYNISKYINTKTLIVTGKYDYAIGPKNHEKFKFQNATVKTLHSKHNTYVEDVNDIVELINNFLNNI